MQFDEMSAIADGLLPKVRLGVIGSASCFHPESPIMCAALGKSLARVESLALITGGRTGVVEALGRSFFQSRIDDLKYPHVYHLLPHGCRPPDYGETLFFGHNMVERREVLGRVAKLYLAIEGGPGTEFEANVALSNNANVIPVGRSGGYSQELYRRMSVPEGITPTDWEALGAERIHPVKLAEVVKLIVSSLIDKNE